MPTETPIVKTNGVVADKVVGEENPNLSAAIEAVKQSLPPGTSIHPDAAIAGYDREKLKDAAWRLTLALETPGDTVQRVAYYASPLHTTVVRIANRLKLLHALVDSRTPKSSKELAEIVNADPVLLLRLLRYLVATGMIGEADADRFEATNITRNLTVRNLEAGINHCLDALGPAVLALPEFLHKNGYQNPSDLRHGPFQDGHRTEDTLFEWLPKHPELLHNFNLWMAGQREGRISWLSFFPLESQLLTNFNGGDDAVLFIDVGGARGHELELIRRRFPNLPGKFILQDLPDTIKQALPTPGVQAVAHDFFNEQPIKGAKCYYLRNVLHDWPDAACESILGKLSAAMTPGYSKILINEMVLPNKGATLIGAQRDLAMMTIVAATERTEQQWRDLIGSAGLKLEEIWTDVPEAESIIVIGKE